MELICNRFLAEFCENHQGFRYSNENCMLQGFYTLCSLVCMLILVYCTMNTFEGALEKILAEEHCYPQFHAKYFMSK